MPNLNESATIEDPIDGWVITSGDDTKARSFEYNELAGNFISWTTELENALWFARRRDADLFAADDEDAWHIRRVSEVRRMWGAPDQSQGVPPFEQSVPHASGHETGAIVTTGTPVPPQPALMPVCRLSDNDLLRLFRAFVQRNATQWVMGSHVHPIWVDLAAHIENERDVTGGPDWRFIQPTNQMPHSVCLQTFDAAYRRCSMTGCGYYEPRGSRQGAFYKGRFVCDECYAKKQIKLNAYNT